MKIVESLFDVCYLMIVVAFGEYIVWYFSRYSS